MRYTDTYHKIKESKPAGIRDHIRKAALKGLSAIDKLNGINSQLNKPRVQFIYIHHVFKDEERALHQLLKTLQKNHTYITYSDAVEKVLNGEIDRPYIAISSDDGFKNNTRAAEIMNEHGAKACFFINPSIVGETNFDTITHYCKDILHIPPVEFLNWNDVDKIQKLGHEIGSHTMGHINIAKAAAREITKDMRSTFKILKQKCGEVKHFAFPYGRFSNFNETGRKACFDAGFVSCAAAVRGCHINHDRKLRKEELCILRDHVVLDWNIDHTLYFLAKNAKKATITNNLFPY